MANVSLVSSDGETFVLSRVLALKSITLRNMIEGAPRRVILAPPFI